MAEKEVSPQESKSRPEATYNEELGKLKADVGKLQSDVAELVGLLKASAADKAAGAKGKYDEEARHALNALQGKLDELIGQSKKTVEDVGDQIGEHPINALLITFSLGFILAKLMDHGGSSGPTG